MPAEDNFNYTPVRYRNGKLGAIYLKYKGVRELMEAARLSSLLPCVRGLTSFSLGGWEKPVASLCTRCRSWHIQVAGSVPWSNQGHGRKG